MNEFNTSKSIHLAAHLFQKERLTLAREWRELTKQELAERIEKTPSAISQFESGKARPDGKTVAELSMALGVPPQFFSRKMGAALPDLESCHFRSLRSATQKQRKVALAMGAMLFDVLSFCEDHVELPLENVSRFSTTIYDEEDIEIFATEMRKNWGLGLGPISNMVKLLESNGVFVTMMPGNCHEVNAFSTWLNGRPFIFLSNKSSSSDLRFDAGHELLHLLAHVDVRPGDRAVEKQADRFSGCFYLPRETFSKECPTRLNWEHFTELKVRWGVSYRSLIMRAFQLGKLSEYQYKRAFMQLSKNKLNRYNEPHEPPMEYPCLLPKSISLVSEDVTMDEISHTLGVSKSFLSELLVTHENRRIQ